MPASAGAVALGSAPAGQTWVSGRLSVGRNSAAGSTWAMPLIRTHVRPAREVESKIEHQFELLSTVRATSDKTHGPAGIRARRAWARKSPERQSRRDRTRRARTWLGKRRARRPARKTQCGVTSAVACARGCAVRSSTRGRSGLMRSPSACAAAAARLAARAVPMASSHGSNAGWPSR